MCLDKITRKYELSEITEEEFEGYKVVFHNPFLMPQGIYPAYFMPSYGTDAWASLPTNVWFRAKESTVTSFSFKSPVEYTSGFHIFKTLEDARLWRHGNKIVKVKYKQVTCEGTQHGGDVVIAKQMMIPEPTELYDFI